MVLVFDEMRSSPRSKILSLEDNINTKTNLIASAANSLIQFLINNKRVANFSLLKIVSVVTGLILQFHPSRNFEEDFYMFLQIL